MFLGCLDLGGVGLTLAQLLCLTTKFVLLPIQNEVSQPEKIDQRSAILCW